MVHKFGARFPSLEDQGVHKRMGTMFGLLAGEDHEDDHLDRAYRDYDLYCDDGGDNYACYYGYDDDGDDDDYYDDGGYDDAYDG